MISLISRLMIKPHARETALLLAFTRFKAIKNVHQELFHLSIDLSQ